jgi:hypothetical protein
MFDNRQLATLILLAAFLTWALTRTEVRGTLASLLKQLVHPKVLGPFLLYGAWLVGLHWLASHLNLWNAKLTGESIFWAGATGLAPLTLAMTDAGKKDNFFRDRALDTVKFAAFFAFFINIKSLSLIGELLVQPIIAFLAMLRAFVEHDEQNRRLRKPLDVLLTVATLALLFYTIWSLVQDWPRLDKGQELRKLVMPIWLTLGAFPFVFIFALIAIYEQVFTRMRVLNDGNRTSLRARLGVMLALRTRLLDIHGFGGPHARQAGRARSIRDGKEAVLAFRSERDGRLSRERSRLARLEALACGVPQVGAGR